MAVFRGIVVRRWSFGGTSDRPWELQEMRNMMENWKNADADENYLADVGPDHFVSKCHIHQKVSHHWNFWDVRMTLGMILHWNGDDLMMILHESLLIPLGSAALLLFWSLSSSWRHLMFFCHFFTFLWLSKRFCNSSLCWSICSKFWMCLVDVSEASASATEAWRQWGVEYFVSQCFTIPCWILCFATCNGAFPILPPVCRTNSQTHLWTNNAFITIPITTLGTS